MSTCPWCSGCCTNADLAPLLSPELSWLWKQVGAVADRRGDQDLSHGTLNLLAPDSADERASAVGLVGGRLRAGQRRSINLTDLTARLRARGANLTPGAVAAHALRRPLAARAAARLAREQAQARLREDLNTMVDTLPGHVAARIGPDAWQRIYRAGTVGWLLSRPDTTGLMAAADAVLRTLPPAGERIDRRTLVRGDPHALDEAQPLARLVLALTGQTGLRPRQAWTGLGVDIDDLTGGLLTVGIHPQGWTIPPSAVVTLPPRELLHVTWPEAPGPESWVFVTENPSVVAAAADTLVRRPGSPTRPVPTMRLLCTSGNPSAIEAEAIAALSRSGWHVAVRADFDPAGLFHVRTLLAACPQAAPWRMDAETYRAATAGLERPGPMAVTADDTPWDPDLGRTMHATGIPVFEETLHASLIEDLLTSGPPRARPSPRK